MQIKKTIIAPVVLTLGSLSIVAGVATPVIASASVVTASSATASPGMITIGG